MNNYLWNDFQKLIKIFADDTYIFIVNDAGQLLKMSRNKYKVNSELVFIKALRLIGQNVHVRTSQNTKKWPADVWFSEIDLIPFNGEKNV